MLRILVEIPRWLLIAGLILAPWAYGAVRPWAIEGLSILLDGLCILWVLECVVRRRLPAVPWLALIPVLGLVLQGWWMTLNAHSFFDPDMGALLPEASFLPGAPGSADGRASATRMFLLTGLLGVFLFCCDLSQYSIWRRRIWMAIVLTGFSIATLGVVQKMAGDPILGLMWEPEKRDLTDTFATFRYRGNAGAYLNLILPLMTGVVFLTFQRDDGPWRKAFWVVALFLLILGIQLNPSRASWFIGVSLTLILGARILLSYGKRHGGITTKHVGVFVLLGALGLTGISLICFLGNWETSWSRWSILGFNLGDRSPIEIYLRMVPDAGVLGFGPGTFGTVFPAYQETYDFGTHAAPLFWREGFFAHAHEDYLETLLEWGCLGTLLWSILLLGGIARGVTRYGQRQTSVSLRWFLFASLLAVGGVLIHALIDFPLQIASIQLYVMVLLGICWGQYSSSARDGEMLG